MPVRLNTNNRPSLQDGQRCIDRIVMVPGGYGSQVYLDNGEQLAFVTHIEMKAGMDGATEATIKVLFAKTGDAK